MRRYHFITGLPRSGSTLLGALLRQNPRFSGGMSSPVSPLVNAVMRASNDGEFSVVMTEDKIRRLVRGVFDAFYSDAEGVEVVFDTNRNWAASLPLIDRLEPEAKVIACVRNPAWVMDSVEQLVRANPLRRSRLFQNDAERATVYSRTETLMHPDRLIGFALNALREAYFGNLSHKMLLVEYDILCQRPRETLQLIYEFVGEPWFEHDFDNVEYAAEDFDMNLNTPGLHRVGRKVEFRPRRPLLPPDTFERLAALAFWHGPHPSRANRIVQTAPNG